MLSSISTLHDVVAGLEERFQLVNWCPEVQSASCFPQLHMVRGDASIVQPAQGVIDSLVCWGE